MHYVALKALPHGQQPGDLFDEVEAIGQIWILAGAARLATPEDLAPKKPSPRRYQRRDLQATEA